MANRRALWFLPLVLLVGLLGIGLSAFAGVRSEVDPLVVISTRALAPVTRHPMPQGLRPDPVLGKMPTAFWLVQSEKGWRAFADQETRFTRCPMEWQENAQRFIDRCGGSLWTRDGLFIGGIADRNLDEFAVIVSAGFVSVDLSQWRKGAPSPINVLRRYVADWNAGRMEQAWTLVHPARQTEFARAVFSGLSAGKDRTFQWSGENFLTNWTDQLKRNGLEGGRAWPQVAELRVVWSYGQPQSIHLAPDEQGAWKLLWSPTFALE